MENEPPKDCPKTWVKNNNIRTRSINYERKVEPMKTELPILRDAEEQKEKVKGERALREKVKETRRLQSLKEFPILGG